MGGGRSIRVQGRLAGNRCHYEIGSSRDARDLYAHPQVTLDFTRLASIRVQFARDRTSVTARAQQQQGLLGGSRLLRHACAIDAKAQRLQGFRCQPGEASTDGDLLARA